MIRRPAGRVATVHVLASTTLTMMRVEAVARRRSPVELCRRFGVGFGGFAATAAAASPLPRRLPGAWWGVETVLRWWPWARDRQCLRRSLALGHQLREFDPVLRLDVISLDPFQAHARLEVRGHSLDMGETGPLVGIGVAG